MKNLTKILQTSELVLSFVLIFIMFTTPLVVDVLLCIKFDYDLNTIEGKQIETASFVYAYAKAMLLEFLVMVLLVNGWKKTSIAFTLTTGIVSLYFYNQFHFVEGFEKHSIEFIYSFMCPIVTAICSHVYIQQKEQENEDEETTLKEYSNILEEQEQTIEQLEQETERNLKTIEQLSKTNESIEHDYLLSQDVIEEVRTLEDQQRIKNRRGLKIIEQQKNDIKKLQKESKVYKIDADKYKEVSTCPYCKAQFIPSGLNRHKSVCAMNPKNIQAEIF